MQRSSDCAREQRSMRLGMWWMTTEPCNGTTIEPPHAYPYCVNSDGPVDRIQALPSEYVRVNRCILFNNLRFHALQQIVVRCSNGTGKHQTSWNPTAAATAQGLHGSCNEARLVPAEAPRPGALCKTRNKYRRCVVFAVWSCRLPARSGRRSIHGVACKFLPRRGITAASQQHQILHQLRVLTRSIPERCWEYASASSLRQCLTASTIQATDPDSPLRHLHDCSRLVPSVGQ